MEERHPEYQYLDLLKEIIETGIEQTDVGTGVKTYSVFGRMMRFDLSKGFPLLTTKKTWFKGLLYELCWFLSGEPNIKYLVDNKVHIWDDYPYKIYLEKMVKGEVPEMSQDDFIEKIASDNDFAEKWGNLNNCYGVMWRKWPAKNGRKVDQLQWMINELKKDPDCHNALVNSWDCEYLYGMALPEEACRFPICHNMYQCNVKNGKLSLILYQRSADIFLGVPFNIASYALLTMLIAKVTGNQPGEFIHVFGDVHAYGDHFDAIKEQLKNEPKPFPTLVIDDSVKNIDDFKPESATLLNYDSHPTIKASLSPTGGLKLKEWEDYVQKKKKQEAKEKNV